MRGQEIMIQFVVALNGIRVAYNDQIIAHWTEKSWYAEIRQ